MGNRHIWMRRAVLVLVSPSFCLGQNAATPVEHSFTVSSSQVWTDTGLDLAASDVLTLTAKVKSGSAGGCAPAGSESNSAESLPLPSAPAGSLIAKTSDKANPVLVGSGREVYAESAGHLFLGFNQTAVQASTKTDCAFAVNLKIRRAQDSSAASGAQPRNVKGDLSSAAKVWLQGQFGNSSSSNTQIANVVSGQEAANGTGPSGGDSGLKVPALLLDADLRKHIDDLPRRIRDHLGNLGDMVNFIIVGSQERSQAALDAAGWHQADVDSKEAGLKAIFNTYEKKDYLQMPMSHLYLFDRVQDFGYEQTQAYAVVASRHHFRLWKAPFTFNNETVWVGAGTHDVGFEKDIRTGKLTHKIDPQVDLERENIAQSLEKSGRVKSMTYYLPPNPVQDAKNASGGGYHSDGKLLVVVLK